MENQKSKSFTVCAPKEAGVVGVVGVLVFGLFIVLSPFMWPDEPAENRTIFYVIFGTAVILCAYLLVKSLRFRVVVKKEKITVIPLLSKTYTFTFDDIETVKRQVKNRYKGKAERVIIYTKYDKKVIVDSSYVSYEKLVAIIIESGEKAKLTGEWQK